MTTNKRKPLGIRAYGSIPHLPNSRLGPSDKSCHAGQAKIATVKARDRYDTIIVQEKLDGSCCSVAKINGEIVALTRAGYRAETSPYRQHHIFKEWVDEQKRRFRGALDEGQRLVGEWMLQAHGTRYHLNHEPFVVFDLMTGHERETFAELQWRAFLANLTLPFVLSAGPPVSVEAAMLKLGEYGHHGALDPAEGAVWRIERSRPTGIKGERKTVVDFLVKYVRPDKVDGKYLVPDEDEDKIFYNHGYRPGRHA